MAKIPEPKVTPIPWRIRIVKTSSTTFAAVHRTFIQEGLTLDSLFYILMPYIAWDREIEIVLDTPDADQDPLFRRIDHALQHIRLMAAFSEPISMHAITYCYNLVSDRVIHSWKALRDFMRQGTMVYIGGGPSVERELQQLKDMHGKAVYVAGGHGILKCKKLGIKPDICLALDPYDTELDVLAEGVWDDVPLIAGAGLMPKMYNEWPGPVYRMPGDQSSDLWRHFEPRAKPIRQGSSVSVWAGHLADYFDAGTVYFVGVDLQEKDGTTKTVWRNESREIGGLVAKFPNINYHQLSQGLQCGTMPFADTLIPVGPKGDVPLVLPPKQPRFKEKMLEAAESLKHLGVHFRHRPQGVLWDAVVKSHALAAEHASWRTQDPNWSLLKACIDLHQQVFQDAAKGGEYPGEPAYLDRSLKKGSNFSLIIRKTTPLNSMDNKGEKDGINTNPPSLSANRLRSLGHGLQDG